MFSFALKLVVASFTWTIFHLFVVFQATGQGALRNWLVGRFLVGSSGFWWWAPLVGWPRCGCASVGWQLAHNTSAHCYLRWPNRVGDADETSSGVGICGVNKIFKHTRRFSSMLRKSSAAESCPSSLWRKPMHLKPRERWELSNEVLLLWWWWWWWRWWC